MQKTLCAVLGLCLLLTLAQSASLTVQVVCQTCPTNECSSQYCYKLSANGFSDTVCVAEGSTCDLTINQTLSVFSCSLDYASAECSSGVCFSASQQPIALLGGKCASTYNQNYTCGSCSAGITCSACQTFKNNTATAVEGCVSGCPSPSGSNLTISACTNSKDFVGVSSTCCMTFDTTYSSAGGVCSTQSTTLVSNNLLKKITGNGSGALHFSTAVVAIIAVLLATMMF